MLTSETLVYFIDNLDNEQEITIYDTDDSSCKPLAVYKNKEDIPYKYLNKVLDTVCGTRTDDGNPGLGVFLKMDEDYDIY